VRVRRKQRAGTLPGVLPRVMAGVGVTAGPGRGLLVAAGQGPAVQFPQPEKIGRFPNTLSPVRSWKVGKRWGRLAAGIGAVAGLSPDQWNTILIS
jgi:hypothetical protein